VSFAAAIAAASAAQPQARPDKVAGRTLLADGDGLAYYCAGNDDTPSGIARRNLETKIESAMRASGADKVLILATSAASHKGHRYAISRIKPYQGKRNKSRRPRNWQFMRELIERDPRTVVTDTLEADDLFHINSVRLGDDNIAILTEDKDMRMVPGWHLHWENHSLVRLMPDTWAFEANDKLFGRKWFWQQMCEGDTVDHVAGLTGCYLGDKFFAQCGPSRAKQILKDCHDEPAALAAVYDQYLRVYGKGNTLDGVIAFIEQACLLWMRRTDRLFDCMDAGGPLERLDQTLASAARRVIRDRVEDL
jgi:Autographiviridae exonuclease